MSWSIHLYLENQQEGLISTLELSKSQKNFLRDLKDLVRVRIKDVFDEVKGLVKEGETQSFAFESVYEQLRKGVFSQYLMESEILEAARILSTMSSDERESFLKISPRFWIQGSYKYKTLNQPYQLPPQEMDIDDGTYLPMDVFDNKPRLGHGLFFLLVDAALRSLSEENSGWLFDGTKKTCSRLKVPSKFVHIDVPMYAIPKDEFVEKETVLKASLESYGSRTFVLDSADYTLDKDKVHLAIREGGWQKSDPKFVADWFQEAITDIGEHVRRTSRFLKAWRDVQWESGGPSSICLMKCIVDTLRNNICDPHDFGDVLLDVANNLELQLNNGVRSPDPSSSSHLFPPRSEHTNEQKAIVDKAIELQVKLNQAISAPTKQIALVYLQELFGERVTNPELIKERKAIPAYSSETVVLPKREISSSMRSG